MPHLYSLTATPTAQETYAKCLEDNKAKSQVDMDAACADDGMKAKEADADAYFTAKYDACIKHLGDAPASDASDSDKAKYEADKSKCVLEKDAAKVAASGDAPWIIVGGILGAAVVIGLVCCYCKKKNDNDE